MLRQFEWDIGSNSIQRLYLSKDTKYLMEVINNITATVYERNNEHPAEHPDEEEDDGQSVEWKFHYQINKFPS